MSSLLNVRAKPARDREETERSRTEVWARIVAPIAGAVAAVVQLLHELLS